MPVPGFTGVALVNAAVRYPARRYHRRVNAPVIRTLLLTDLVDSTRLVHALGDVRAAEVLARHDALARDLLRLHAGVEIDRTDGFLFLFERPIDAVRYALVYHVQLRALASDTGVALRARAAVHLGEVVLRRNPPEHVALGAKPLEADGLAKPIAARLVGLATAGQTLLTRVAAELARRACEGEAEQPVFLSLGAWEFKGVPEPVDVHEVTAPGAMPIGAPPDGEKAWRAGPRESPNNLPAELTEWIGREDEREEVRSLLRTTRVLTITGAGGVGKTRLALRVVRDVLDRFPDGVRWADLAPIHDPSGVPLAVLEALGVPEERGHATVDLLLEHLSDRSVLLVLDNCEHLLDACAGLIDRLLRRTSVRVLTTSREPLGISGETSWRLPSMPVPAPGAADLARYDAVRLFVARAAAARPGFALTPANAPVVTAICARLDGIPLAMELAAARLKAMPIETVAERLTDRFRLLTGGSRMALPRQQTLRALVDWSHDLLDPPERVVFRRLAVFVGGWSLEAAEVICAGGEIEAPDVALHVTRLVERSMVVLDEEGDEPRWRLLETLRQYARDRLVDSGEAFQARRRHFDHYADRLRQHRAHLVADEPGWRRWLARERDNLRAVTEWIEADPERQAGWPAIADGLYYRWETAGALEEGYTALRRLLSLPGGRQDTAERAAACQHAGDFACDVGEAVDGRALYTEALRIYDALGDPSGRANVLVGLAMVDNDAGDVETARARLEEALALHRASGNPTRLAHTLQMMTVVPRDLEEARRYAEEGLALARRIRDPRAELSALHNLAVNRWIAGDLGAAERYTSEVVARAPEVGLFGLWGPATLNLGLYAATRGAWAQAAELLREGLKLLRRYRQRRIYAEAFEALAEVALAEGRAERAALLLGAGDAARTYFGWKVPDYWIAIHRRVVDGTHAALGGERAAALRERGRALPLQDAVTFALEADPSTDRSGA